MSQTAEERVLFYLRRNRSATRAEIAGAVGMSTVSAGRTIDSLIEGEFIRQKPKLTDAAGRRGSKVSLNDAFELAVLDLSRDSFVLRFFALSGKQNDERPYLHNRYLTREENAAAFIRSAALYLNKHDANRPVAGVAVLLPFADRPAGFADYCEESFIRHQLSVRFPDKPTFIFNDAVSAGAALYDRTMPHPDALIYLHPDRSFIAFANEEAPVDLSACRCGGKALSDCVSENAVDNVAEFLLNASVLLGIGSCLMDSSLPYDAVQAAIRHTAPSAGIVLFPSAHDSSLYASGASLLLQNKLLNIRFQSKGDL